MKVESGLSEHFRGNLLEAIKQLEDGRIEAEIPETSGMQVRRMANADPGKLVFATHEVGGEVYFVYRA